MSKKQNTNHNNQKTLDFGIRDSDLMYSINFINKKSEAISTIRNPQSKILLVGFGSYLRFGYCNLEFGACILEFFFFWSLQFVISGLSGLFDFGFRILCIPPIHNPQSAI